MSDNASPLQSALPKRNIANSSSAEEFKNDPRNPYAKNRKPENHH